MGKHAYRLIKEELGLRTKRHSFQYKEVTMSYLKHLNSNQICTNILEFDSYNKELQMYQVKSGCGSRTLRIVRRLLRQIESTNPV